MRVSYQLFIANRLENELIEAIERTFMDLDESGDGQLDAEEVRYLGA